MATETAQPDPARRAQLERRLALMERLKALETEPNLKNFATLASPTEQELRQRLTAEFVSKRLPEVDPSSIEVIGPKQNTDILFGTGPGPRTTLEEVDPAQKQSLNKLLQEKVAQRAALLSNVFKNTPEIPLATRARLSLVEPEDLETELNNMIEGGTAHAVRDKDGDIVSHVIFDQNGKAVAVTNKPNDLTLGDLADFTGEAVRIGLEAAGGLAGAAIGAAASSPTLGVGTIPSTVGGAAIGAGLGAAAAEGISQAISPGPIEVGEILQQGIIGAASDVAAAGLGPFIRRALPAKASIKNIQRAYDSALADISKKQVSPEEIGKRLQSLTGVWHKTRGVGHPTLKGALGKEFSKVPGGDKLFREAKAHMVRDVVSQALPEKTLQALTKSGKQGLNTVKLLADESVDHQIVSRIVRVLNESDPVLGAGLKRAATEEVLGKEIGEFASKDFAAALARTKAIVGPGNTDTIELVDKLIRKSAKKSKPAENLAQLFPNMSRTTSLFIATHLMTGGNASALAAAGAVDGVLRLRKALPTILSNRALGRRLRSVLSKDIRPGTSAMERALSPLIFEAERQTAEGQALSAGRP